MGLAPLIGLAALAGLETFREPITDRQNAIRGRNRQRSHQRGSGAEETPRAGLLADIGIGDAPQNAGDPMRRGGSGNTLHNESGALFYGGDELSTNDFLNQRYKQDLQAQNEQAAMARQQVSSAAGMMNAQTNRMQANFAMDAATAAKEEASAQQALRFKEMEDAVKRSGNQAWQDGFFGEFATTQSQKAIGDAALNAQFNTKPYTQPEQLLVDKWGANALNVEPKTLQMLDGIENAIEATDTALQYVDDTTAVGRAMSQEDKGRIMADYSLQSINFLRQYTDAGAMQKADLELFESMIGNPDSWKNLTDETKGQMINIMSTMEEKRRSVSESNQLTYSPYKRKDIVSATGETLEALSADDVNAAVQGAKEAAAASADGGNRSARREAAAAARAAERRGAEDPERKGTPNPRRRGTN